MKNLHRKISALLLSGSIVMAGSLSNGLIAHADSIEYKSSQKFSKKVDIDNQGDAQIVKGAKNIYGYGILGYYVDSLSKRKIENDVKELVGWFSDSESRLNKVSHRFNYAKDFIEHLKKEGMEEGIQRVIIGDAEAILLFRKDVERGIDWNKHSDKWIYNDGQNIDGIDDIDGM